MASACIHEQDLGKVIKYLHPNIVSHKKAAVTFSHLITDVVIGIETETVHAFCWRQVKKNT